MFIERGTEESKESKKPRKGEGNKPEFKDIYRGTKETWQLQQKLWKKFRETGCTEARQKLVDSYMPYVENLVSRELSKLQPSLDLHKGSRQNVVQPDAVKNAVRDCLCDSIDEFAKMNQPYFKSHFLSNAMVCFKETVNKQLIETIGIPILEKQVKSKKKTYIETDAMRQEEVQLWDQFKTSDCEKTRDKLIEFYIPYVENAILREIDKIQPIIEKNDLEDMIELNIEDLNSAAFIALVGLLERFPYLKHDSFKGRLSQEVRSVFYKELYDVIGIPKEIFELREKLDNAAEVLQEKLLRNPSVFEIAEEMNMEADKVSNIIYMAEHIVEPVEQLDKFKYAKNLISEATQNLERSFDNKIIYEYLPNLLSILMPREQKIIYYRFFEKKTLEEVSLLIGVTRERVRQIEGRALRRIRHPRYAKLIKDFVRIEY